MTVVCACSGCPYCCENFCSQKGILMLNENGLCSHLYDKNNAIKPNAMNPVDRSNKDLPIIIEGGSRDVQV